MEKIKTLEDIKNMQTSSQALQKHLVSYFGELHQSLGNEKPVNEFSLEEHGPITILAGQEDLYKKNLLDSWPEYIERLKLNDEIYHRVFVVTTNDFVEIYYLPDGNFSPEIKTWLEKYTAYESDLEIQENTDIPF